jgi:hypothetical protein
METPKREQHGCRGRDILGFILARRPAKQVRKVGKMYKNKSTYLNSRIVTGIYFVARLPSDSFISEHGSDRVLSVAEEQREKTD